MLKEECGIFGVFEQNEAAKYVYLGLNFLQHRGQESCGIVSSDGISLYKQTGIGKVLDFFDESKIEYLKGYNAIGHVRYSTTGSPVLVNAQPITAVTSKGAIAVAHNGNITNAFEIRKELTKNGNIFYTSSDSEIILHLISIAPFDDLIFSVKWALSKLEGAFSILILSKDIMIAARDPNGFRPLSLGKIGNNIGEFAVTYLISSEDSAFSIVDGHFIREINPNEILVLSEKGLTSLNIKDENKKISQCIFELIYFSKPSSHIFNKSVYDFRYQIGRQLAREHPVNADYVIPIPDSGLVASIGYSDESKIPLAFGLIRSHYVGRTFIEPSQKIRDFGVKLKFIPVKELIENKKIIIIDDSIVRGTTSKKIVKVIKSCNPKEIHFRVASPPVKHPCFYGIDFSTSEELLANKMNSYEEIAKYIGVDSVGYVSIDGMFNLTGLNKDLFCKACFDGKYPTKLNEFSKGGLENDIKEKYIS